MKVKIGDTVRYQRESVQFDNARVLTTDDETFRALVQWNDGTHTRQCMVGCEFLEVTNEAAASSDQNTAA